MLDCEGMLPADLSAEFERSNTLYQFNDTGALGVNIMGKNVPIVFDLELAPGKIEKVIIFDRPPAANCPQYEDRFHDVECHTEYTFDISYYKKQYHRGSLGRKDLITFPYTYDLIEYEDVGLPQMQFTQRREWYNGNRIYKAEMLQDCGGCDEAYPTSPEVVTQIPVDESKVVDSSQINNSKCRC